MLLGGSLFTRARCSGQEAQNATPKFSEKHDGTYNLVCVLIVLGA